MNLTYIAIVTREGDARLAEFPDCPGCQTFVRGRGDLAAMAKDALEGWLEVSLEDGEVAPLPGFVRIPQGAECMVGHDRPRHRRRNRGTPSPD